MMKTPNGTTSKETTTTPTKRSVFILQRPKKQLTTTPNAKLADNHHHPPATPRTSPLANSLCSSEHSSVPPQVALKLALCRPRNILTRDDLVAYIGHHHRGTQCCPKTTNRATCETMSSDSTTASDFDTCHPESSPLTSIPPPADSLIVLLERCSVISSEVSASLGTFLTLSGSDIALLKEYMHDHLVENPRLTSSRLRVQIGSSGNCTFGSDPDQPRGPLHMFVHRPPSNASSVSSFSSSSSSSSTSSFIHSASSISTASTSDVHAQLAEWRKRLKSSSSVLLGKRRLMKFLCDQDEHFQVSDDHLELKRFISDFLRPQTCVDALVQVANGIAQAVGIRIRTGETPPTVEKKQAQSNTPARWARGSTDQGHVSPLWPSNSSAGGSPSSRHVTDSSRSSSISPPTSSVSSASGMPYQSRSVDEFNTPLAEWCDAPSPLLDGPALEGPPYGMMLDEPCNLRPADLFSKSHVVDTSQQQGFTPSFSAMRCCDYPPTSSSPEPISMPLWDNYYWDFAPSSTRIEADYYPYTATTPTAWQQHCPASHRHMSPMEQSSNVLEKRYPNISFSTGPCAVATNDILCCFWDLESTGLRVASDQVIQIGCTARVFHKPSGANQSEAYFSLLPGLSESRHDFNLYVTTELEIPDEVSGLTNITNDLLERQGVDLASALRLWHNWIDDMRMQLLSSIDAPCELWMVAHNGNQFDLPMLFLQELQRLKWTPGTLFKEMGVDAIVDSVVLSRALYFAEQECKSHLWPDCSTIVTSVDGQKVTRVVSRSHRLSDLYWNSFHELMPNQHNALCDAKAVSMVMAQEPFLHAWRHEAVAWRLDDYIAAWHRAYGAYNRQPGFENIINKLLSESAACMPPTPSTTLSSSPIPNTITSASSPSVPANAVKGTASAKGAARDTADEELSIANHSIAMWRSFRERTRLRQAATPATGAQT
eukprot:Blabericola_migrator_1__2794@NODE_17_length_22983_cov_74_609923_g14_i0_p2_GENE_NODE_17_length_22983_cov_74_609923_g14_i0NODE_17_length_22983_cov_74_609923_g14_i0_p2_ORF_typecomplete_len939_score111_59RNase_T/PF00929_24/3_2e12DUF5051/PF16473_5/0_5_NODE_17_length_22983_cov_74_609923_g14_i0827011086